MGSNAKNPTLMVLTNGFGSTVSNLLERGMFVKMIASKNTRTLPIAQAHNVPFLLSKDDQAIMKTAFGLGIDLIILAGWTSLLPIPYNFKDRILNIHPSLLPKYGGKGMYGINIHKAVLAAGEKVTGCTVHLVDSIYDHGKILAQKEIEIPILHDGSSDPRCDNELYKAMQLQQIVQKVERDLLPLTISAYANSGVL